MWAMRRTAGVLALGAVLVLGGCGAGAEVPGEPLVEAVETPDGSPTAEPTPTAEPVQVQVALGVSAAHAIVDDALCMGWGEYAAFNTAGPQVLVKDADGEVVGIGSLGESEPLEDLGCVRWAHVEVPAGGRFYTAEVDDWSSDAIAESDLADRSISIVIDQ